MAELRPVGLATLAARAFEELERNGSIFDLPRRSFVLEPRHHVAVHGQRVGAPLGPAAGPHTQLAQNIVSSWLGGGRVMELKTVQVLDRVKIARPCIDARTVGYNVEWSQELSLDQSRGEYVKGSMLIELLAHGFRVEPAVLFDVSVGYDFAGITSERVVGFLKRMIDARSTVDALRDHLPRQFRDFAFTTNIANSVTLSTFHGCPPHEIERIADFLMAELGLDLAIKLNPTLLGEYAVNDILHDRLGYADVIVPATAFGNDPAFEDIARIQRRAKELGRSFAVKLTNTLIVENRRGVLPGEFAYLSGPPLHVLAMHLVQRFRHAFGTALPISFSAGIDRVNYPDAVRLGLKPVTVCTDLLKQGGYARLHAYASELTRRMGAMTMEEFATGNIDDYIAELDRNPRYHRDHVERVPRKTGVPLEVFDCATCDLCIPACPNDANFRIPLAMAKPHQIVTLDDLCNDCGNCEAFCPDIGAPNRVKLRVRADTVVPDHVRAAIHDPARVNFINAIGAGGIMTTAVLEEVSLLGRSMLLTNEWSRAELDVLCEVAATLEARDRAGLATPLLAHELHYALFFDNSTRTKSSWAGASVRLGGQPMVVDGSSTQVAHGETAQETGAMLGMNAHALGIRHDLIVGEGNRFMRGVKEGIDAYLRDRGDGRVVPIVNLQCDVDHPTQTLADLCWLRERFPDGLAGKTMAVTWAYSPSYAKPLSVPQGLIMLMTRFGMNVRLAHPPGYDLMPQSIVSAYANSAQSGGSFEQVRTMDEAFDGADIVYPKSWGPYDLMLERVGASGEQMKDIERRALQRNRAYMNWICDERRMALTKDALYMHCLPADIGAEVSAGVLERFRFSLAREANKKLYVIMALLAVAKIPNLAERLRNDNV